MFRRAFRRTQLLSADRLRRLSHQREMTGVKMERRKADAGQRYRVCRMKRVSDDGVGPDLRGIARDSAWGGPKVSFRQLNDVVVAVCFPDVVIDRVLAEVAHKHERVLPAGRAVQSVTVASDQRRYGDGYGQPAAAITSAVLERTVDGHSAGDLTRDDVLDDITLYWLTNTAVSAARFYWESHINLYNAADLSFPTAVSVFPGENYQASRSWTERAYHKLIYFNEVDAGGHYAAWEQPRLFSEEVRAGFRSLRS